MVLGDCVGPSCWLHQQGSLSTWPNQCKAIRVPWDFSNPDPLRWGGARILGLEEGVYLFLRKYGNVKDGEGTPRGLSAPPHLQSFPPFPVTPVPSSQPVQIVEDIFNFCKNKTVIY